MQRPCWVVFLSFFISIDLFLAAVFCSSVCILAQVREQNVCTGGRDPNESMLGQLGRGKPYMILAVKGREKKLRVWTESVKPSAQTAPCSEKRLIRKRIKACSPHHFLSGKTGTFLCDWHPDSPRNITVYTRYIQSSGSGCRKLKRGKRHTGAPSRYL